MGIVIALVVVVVVINGGGGGGDGGGSGSKISHVYIGIGIGIGIGKREGLLLSPGSRVEDSRSCGVSGNILRFSEGPEALFLPGE